MAGEIALTKDAAAMEASFSVATIDRAIREGDLRSIKIGRARRVLRADLIAWLESKREVKA